MSGPVEPPVVISFFGTQMIISVIGNLIRSGLLDPDVVLTNIQETIDQGTIALAPEHHQYLPGIAKVFEEVVQRARQDLS